MLSVLRDLCVQRTTLNVAHATLLVAVHTCSASQAAMYNAQRGTRNTFGGCAHLQCLTSCSVQCSTWHTQHFWWLCTLAVPHKLQCTMLNVAHATLLVAVHTCSASQAAAYNAQRGTRNTFGGCAHLQCLTSCSVQCSMWHATLL